MQSEWSGNLKNVLNGTAHQKIIYLYLIKNEVAPDQFTYDESLTTHEIFHFNTN